MTSPYRAAKDQRVWVIVLAGGSGGRFGGAKQFSDVGGRTLLQRTIDAAAPTADGIAVVVPSAAAQGAELAAAHELTCPLVVTPGGAHRAESVRAGLACVPDDVEFIVIADSAHPLASPALYLAVIGAVTDGADGAVPGLPLTEVIASVDDNGVRIGGIGRDGHVLVQMPHAFRASVLRLAHARALAAGSIAPVEDSALVAEAGGKVVVVPGEPWNIHVTTPQELQLAQALVRGWQ